jgi:hypothetical protein
VVFAEALFDVDVRSGPKTPTKRTATHIDTIERPAQIYVDSHPARDDRVSPVARACTGTVLTLISQVRYALRATRPTHGRAGSPLVTLARGPRIEAAPRLRSRNSSPTISMAGHPPADAAHAEVAYARATVDEGRDGECGEGPVRRAREDESANRRPYGRRLRPPRSGTSKSTRSRRPTSRRPPRLAKASSLWSLEDAHRVRRGEESPQRAESQAARQAGRRRDRQLGARVARRHPRVRRSEVRESRIANGSVTKPPRAAHARSTDAFSPSRASKRPANRHTSRPVTRSGQLLKKTPLGLNHVDCTLTCEGASFIPNTQRRAFYVLASA